MFLFNKTLITLLLLFTCNWSFGFNGVTVISDLHLNFIAGADFNNITSTDGLIREDVNKTVLDAVLDKIQESGTEDLIINGDLFDGRSTGSLNWEQKAELIVNFLTFVQNKTGKRVHFNVGNHDEDWSFKTLPPTFIPEFSEILIAKLKKIEGPNISIIGTDSREVYRYSIGPLNFEISHSPFVKSTELTRQLQRVKASPIKDDDGYTIGWEQNPAVTKVERTPNITEAQKADGLIRVYSDNHLALADHKNRIYDTGKLTDDVLWQPDEPSSFLVLDKKGRGEFFNVDKTNGRISKLNLSSPSGLSCGSFL